MSVPMLTVSITPPLPSSVTQPSTNDPCQCTGGWRELNHLSKLKPLALQYFYRGIAYDLSLCRLTSAFERTQSLKNMPSFLFIIPPVRSEFPAWPTRSVIYNAAVIPSRLTFRGHGKSGVFWCERVFIIGGRSATFWRPSWACSKVSDPDYWVPSSGSRQPGGAGSTAHSKKRTLVKSKTNLTRSWNVIDSWCPWEKKKGLKSNIFLVLIVDMTHLQLQEWWKTCGGSKKTKQHS